MGLFMGFITEEATLQRMLLKNYPVVLSGLNFYACIVWLKFLMPDDFTREYREALQLNKTK